MRPTVHVGIVAGEQLPQHVAEGRELLADDGAGEPAGAQQLGAAEPVGQIRRLHAQVGQRRVLRQRQRGLVVLDLLLRALQIGALRQRVADRGVDVGRGPDRRHQVGRLEAHEPEVRALRIDDEQRAAGPPPGAPASARRSGSRAAAPLPRAPRRDRAAATVRRRRAPGCSARARARGRAIAAAPRRPRCASTRFQ